MTAPPQAGPPAPDPRRRPLRERLRAAREGLLAVWTVDQWRLGMAVHGLLWGAGYLAGPAAWSSSSSLDVIRSVGVPIRAWGALAILLALSLLVRRWACHVHSVAAVLWFVWTAGLLLALPYGSLAAWGGWLHTAVVSAIHRHLSGAGRINARR